MVPPVYEIETKDIVNKTHRYYEFIKTLVILIIAIIMTINKRSWVWLLILLSTMISAYFSKYSFFFALDVNRFRAIMSQFVSRLESVKAWCRVDSLVSIELVDGKYLFVLARSSRIYTIIIVKPRITSGGINDKKRFLSLIRVKRRGKILKKKITIDSHVMRLKKDFVKALFSEGLVHAPSINSPRLFIEIHGFITEVTFSIDDYLSEVTDSNEVALLLSITKRLSDAINEHSVRRVII